METNTSRQAKGVRAGGQLTAIAHSEPAVTLTPVGDTRPGAGTPQLGKREMFGPGTLADRSPAWTPTAIKKFLGEPDKLVTNPVYRNSPKMRMFLTERVENVEASEERKAWEDASRRRTATSGRRKEDKSETKVEVGHGRNGSYPVARR